MQPHAIELVQFTTNGEFNSRSLCYGYVRFVVRILHNPNARAKGSAFEYAKAFGATGLIIDRPDDTVPVMKKAFETQGPVIVGVCRLQFIRSSRCLPRIRSTNARHIAEWRRGVALYLVRTDFFDAATISSIPLRSPHGPGSGELQWT
jgi:hypothetical protein